MGDLSVVPVKNHRQKLILPKEITKVECIVSWKKSDLKYVDLNLMAVLFDNNGSILDGVYYNNLNTNGVKHLGRIDECKEEMHIHFDNIDTNIKVIFIVCSCYIGNLINDVLGGEIKILGEAGGKEYKLYDLSPLKDNQGGSCNISVCRFMRKSDEVTWELMAISKVLDCEERLLDCIPHLCDDLPTKLKTIPDIKYIATEQSKIVFEKLQKPYYCHPDTSKILNTYDNGKLLNVELQIGLSWDAIPGQIRTNHFLNPNILSFSNHGSKIYHVDDVEKMSTDKAINFLSYNYRFGDKGDVCASINLSKVSQTVNSIVIVGVAASNVGTTSFATVRNPCIKIYAGEKMREIFRISSPFSISGNQNWKSFIACVLKRTITPENMIEWNIEPVGNLSQGYHALFDASLKEDIQKIVPSLPFPESQQLNAQNPEVQISDIDLISYDFTAFDSIDTVFSFDFNQYGKIHDMKNKSTTTGRRTLSLSQSFTKIKPSLTTTLSSLKNNSIYSQVIVLCTSMDEKAKTETISPQTKTLKIYNQEEQYLICSIDVNITNGSVAILSLERQVKQQEKNEKKERTFELNVPWKFRYLNEKIKFSPENVSKYMKNVIHFAENTFVKSDDFKLINYGKEEGNTTSFPLSTNDKSSSDDLLVAVGFEGKFEKGIRHRLNLEAELYDYLSNFYGSAYEEHTDLAFITHYPFLSLKIDGQNDEEQIHIRRGDHPIKYIALNLEVKSRSLLNREEKVYIRILNSTNGCEILKYTVPASIFLQGYQTTTEVQKDINTEDNADDESTDYSDDVESLSPCKILMLILCLDLNETRVTAVGKQIEVPIPEYIPEPPTKIKIDLICARDLLARDLNGFSDPYVKIKLNEKYPQSKKKQKIKSKIKYKTLNPTYDESFTFKIFSGEDILVIRLMDWDALKADDHLGFVEVSIADALSPENEGKDRWLKLDGAAEEGETMTGEVCIRFTRV